MRQILADIHYTSFVLRAVLYEWTGSARDSNTVKLHGRKSARFLKSRRRKEEDATTATTSPNITTLTLTERHSDYY